MAVLLGAAWTTAALAGSHLWRVNEIFSNPDGSIQFIELHEYPLGAPFVCGADQSADSLTCVAFAACP